MKVEREEPPEVLATLLYHELRRLAAARLRGERPNHTLQPTALVNEAYLRLAAQLPRGPEDRVQFLVAASRLMREILIDYARTRNRAKRGGGQAPVCIEDVAACSDESEVDLIALDDALNALERIDPEQRKLVELRYFGGLSIEETAQALGVSSATVKREWRIARAWLHRELSAVSSDEH
jgi:RNA polymerase sigma factor (TIGR02999 family)